MNNLTPIPADPYRNLGPATILRADARTLPLADNSVDLVVTSPPYFALRSYQDNGEHYAGQLGSEATPAEFVDALIDCTREMVRVVKPSGSIWINLGDKYANAPPSLTSERVTGLAGGRSFRSSRDRTRRDFGIRTKSLLGIPWRYALRCIDDLGLILRAEVIWSKPNGLPESVTDRVRRSHEQWFHFTPSPRYYSAVDEIRESQVQPQRSTGRIENRGTRRVDGGANQGFGLNGETPREYNPLGKLPGSVWTIPTEPLRVPDHLGVDHFAAFPSEWPKRIIRGWSPAGVCTACGEGRRPVAERTAVTPRRPARHKYYPASHAGTTQWMDLVPEWGITGYVCACTPYTDHPGTGERYGGVVHSGGAQGTNKGSVAYHIGDAVGGSPARRVGPWREYHFDRWTPAPTTPALILDPFGGTGTVAMVARALGRHGIHADLSADYNRLAHWRITDLDQLAAVQGHERTKREPDTDDLLTLLNDGGAP